MNHQHSTYHLRNKEVTIFPTAGLVGWCVGPGQTSIAGASYNLDVCRARAYCACSRCGSGCLDIFVLL